MIGEFSGRYPRHLGEVRVYRAPGRVNLIGEHTDYNLGFVLPMALDLACYVAGAISEDGCMRVYSEAQQEAREWSIEELRGATPSGHWTDYLVGVAQELARAGFGLEGRNLIIRSTVPEGSGLSSSAALEVSCAIALLDGRHLDPLELAKLCRRAEVEFVGMPCGIMDQYVSVFGRENAAIRIDCRSLEHRVVPLPAGISFLAVNSMVKHELASSAYRERTEECASAVEMIRQEHPEVESLRDVSLKLFEGVAPGLPPVIQRRARHVVSENSRVEQFVAASIEQDLEKMGRLLISSHVSLQHDYEVSCPELDFLVDAATGIQGVFGARMTGGGFGGCTVNMMKAETAGAFRAKIMELYRDRFGITPQVFLCRPSAGAGPVRNPESIPPAPH